MQSQKLSIDDTCDGKPVEAFNHQVIYFLIEFLQTFLSEIMINCHLPTFMVAS